MEVLCPVKFAIFLADNDLMETNISHNFAFYSCCTDEVAKPMQPVIFIVIIVLSKHVDKTIVNTKGETGTSTKGKDEIP